MTCSVYAKYGPNTFFFLLEFRLEYEYRQCLCHRTAFTGILSKSVNPNACDFKVRRSVQKVDPVPDLLERSRGYSASINPYNHTSLVYSSNIGQSAGQTVCVFQQGDFRMEALTIGSLMLTFARAWVTAISH